MPDTPTNPDIKEAVSVLLARLPKPVQDFVTGPRRAEVAVALTKKYNLHLDQAGTFEHVFIQMLLGVVSPDEFITKLRAAGIPEEAVMGLAHDVNEEVFKPLRKLEEGDLPVPVANEPAVPSPVINSPAYREPIPEPSPVTPVAPIEHAPPTPPPPPAWQPPYPQSAPPPPQFVPMPPGTYWVPVSIAQVPPPPPAPQPVAPAAPLPTPEPSPTSTPEPVPDPTEPTPAPRPQWTPPVNLPTGMPPVPPPPQIPITKEYGADPYREPV